MVRTRAVVVAILYYPVGALITQDIDDDPQFGPKSVAPGESRAVAVAADLVTREVDVKSVLTKVDLDQAGLAAELRSIYEPLGYRVGVVEAGLLARNAKRRAPAHRQEVAPSNGLGVAFEFDERARRKLGNSHEHARRRAELDDDPDRQQEGRGDDRDDERPQVGPVAGFIHSDQEGHRVD